MQLPFRQLDTNPEQRHAALRGLQHCLLGSAYDCWQCSHCSKHLTKRQRKRSLAPSTSTIYSSMAILPAPATCVSREGSSGSVAACPAAAPPTLSRPAILPSMP